MSKEPITLNGLKNLKDELVYLKEEKRPEVYLQFEARSHGDLKENAEYHAKEEQSHNEGRITEINDIILELMLLMLRYLIMMEK